MREWLTSLRRALYFASALLLALSAARFGGQATAQWAGERVPFLESLAPSTPESISLPVDPTTLGPLNSMEAAMEAGVEIPPELRRLMAEQARKRNAASGKAGASSQGQPVSLIVSAGPDRAELFVNGVPVGRTPYVGQIHCKQGSSIKIEILPGEGMPIRRLARCLGDTVHVR